MLDLNITMAFQLVNFLIAIYVLNILLIRPIRDIIKKRNGIMDGMAEEAESCLLYTSAPARCPLSVRHP